MPRHDFGKIEPNQLNNEFHYASTENNCISINDDYILPLLEELKMMKTFHHNITKPKFGLDYWGITIIPPESLGFFQDCLLREAKRKHHAEINELIALVTETIQEDKHLIHFGI